jgi:hypothetical protein
MEQLELHLLTVYNGPRLVPAHLVEQCKTFREAVRLCWAQRTRVNLTRARLAEEAGLYASHVTDYLSPEEVRRELPAKKIDAVERVLGNRAITQWMLLQTRRSDEEVAEQAERRAA